MKPFKISSLGRAIALAIPAYLVGLVLFAFLFWSAIFLCLVFIFSGQPDTIPFLIAPVAIFAIAVVWYLAIKIIYDLLLRLLWSKPPQLLRSGGFKQSLKTCSDIFLVTLPITSAYILVSVFIVASQSCFIREYSTDKLVFTYQCQQSMLPLDRFLLQGFWFWLLSAIVFYNFARK